MASDVTPATEAHTGAQLGAPLPAELLAMLGGPALTFLATRGANLEPEVVQVFGARAHPDEPVVSIFAPAAQAATSLTNAQSNGEMSLLLVRASNHHSLQAKGTLRATRPADGAGEEAYVTDYATRLTEELSTVGIPASVCRRFVLFPVVVLEMVVRDVFRQTPGPGAGQALSPSAQPSRP